MFAEYYLYKNRPLSDSFLYRRQSYSEVAAKLFLVQKLLWSRFLTRRIEASMFAAKRHANNALNTTAKLVFVSNLFSNYDVTISVYHVVIYQFR